MNFKLKVKMKQICLGLSAQKKKTCLIITVYDRMLYVVHPIIGRRIVKMIS